MATFAVINNGVVQNCIVADSLAIAEAVTGFVCIEYTAENVAEIGYLYENETFINPNLPVETEQE
jgi:hypothetical protein